MLRTRTISYVLAAALAGGVALTAGSLVGDHVAEAGKAKKAKKKPAKGAKKAPAKVALTPEQKKAREELLGPFKWGMSKDEVIKALSKQLDERYAEQIAETSDVYKQDKLRKEKAKEIKRVKKSWVAFEGKKTGWDVSIIDEQFAHGTDEAMLEYWENQGGRNQRRFFFFQDGALYKMFLQIDTTQFESEQANFEYFAGLMGARFGEDVLRTPSDGEHMDVRVIDKTRFYDAFCIVVQDPDRARTVAAVRADRVKDDKPENNILKAVVESGDTSGPDLDSNKDAIDGIIGGGKKQN